MTPVFWLKEALADLRGIHAYIARDNPAAARRVIKKIRDGVDILNTAAPAAWTTALDKEVLRHGHIRPDHTSG